MRGDLVYVLPTALDLLALAACLGGLTVSSIGELVGRAVDMSGRSLSAILSVLPTVLFRTHYGRAWLIRPVALTGLWAGWWVGRGRLHARAIPILMLGAWALIALTRSTRGADGLATSSGRLALGRRPARAFQRRSPGGAQATRPTPDPDP
jgi:hypothetical protein